MSVSDQTQKSECATGKSALPSTTGIVSQTCQVRKVPPYSLRSGFTAYFELSPVNGFFSPPSLAQDEPLRNLTPAPRRQDHTTSPYAEPHSSVAASASIASHRTFVTMANAPHLP